MHELHKYLAQTLVDRLKSRRVVTWYDPRSEFVDFIGELAGGNIPVACRIDSVKLSDLNAQLCVMQDSFFEVKFTVEPLVSGDWPDPLLIYLPGRDRDKETAVLMELEAGGSCYEPALKRTARRVLKKQFGDGRIDQFLESPNVNYRDVVSLMESGSTGGIDSGALLDVIFSDARGNNAELLAAWLASSDNDDKIVKKGADRELLGRLQTRLGLTFDGSQPLDEVRRKTIRYVLVGEFRNDLKGSPPPSLEMVQAPTSKPHLELVLQIATALRKRHPEAYLQLADSAEQELSLTNQGIAPESLGSIDTFRFEERFLLDYSGQLIIDGKFSEALSVIKQRRLSFWASQQIDRQEQWRVYELAAQLGDAVAVISQELPAASKTAVHWIEAYTADSGWYRADLLHRRLESAVSALSDAIESERVLHRVHADYDDLINRMAQGFIKAFEQSNWAIPGVLHQAQVYSKRVNSPGERVAYILVDALRYEMGVELQGLLDRADELTLEPAVAAIPTITPIGMAALMPGAEASFTVVEHKNDIASRIEGSIATGLADRRKIWKGQVPKIADIELDKILSSSNSQLEKKIADAPLILVRSVEIDAMGEGGHTFLARQVINTALSNVARAIKRLATMGISKFVVAADHGHLFIAPRDESQRIDKPGGEQVSMHRRVWVGRGGATPAGTTRISAAKLGYDNDLDFVFPTGTSVFKSGGDLAYYHGGLTLQELLIPVLSVRMPISSAKVTSLIEVELTDVPSQVANQIVTFGMKVEADLFASETVEVRPVLLCNGQHIGHPNLALDAELDPLTHTVKIRPGVACKVGIQLLRTDIDSLEIVVLDPETDRVLAKSNKLAVKLGIH